MIAFKANNINELQLKLLTELKNDSQLVKSRGMEVKEIYPVLLELTNVRNRMTSLVKRKWNLIFALGEFSWHLSKSNELDFINYYSKNWDIASNDGVTIPNSCYGKKIFGSDTWNNLIFELQEDNDTRRSVINLYSDSFLGLKTNDVSCTLNLQFLIRNGKLDLIASMRSNDIIWGLPNDIFFFTMIQELLANELNIETGKYFHHVNSLHIYKRHYQLMDEIIENPQYTDFEMPEMTSIKEVSKFIELEKNYRIEENTDLRLESNYWNELLDILKLRGNNLSYLEKDYLIENSPYSQIIKLCPTTYIKNSASSCKH